MRTDLTLVKHGTLYLLARGLPGLINFLALAIYTRILPAEDYGKYALLMAGAGLVQSMAFGCLRAGAFRYYPKHAAQDRARFLSTVSAGYLGLALLTGAMGCLLPRALPQIPLPRDLWLLGIALVWAQAYYELNLSLLVAGLAPFEYGLLSIGKAGLTLVIAVTFVRLGWGAAGMALGLIVGMVLPTLPRSLRKWQGARPDRADWPMLLTLLAYGLPLSVSHAMGALVFSAGRLMLTWFSGMEAVGLYAATYDLTQQTITMLMMIVNLAALPLALHALEKRGVAAAQSQLQQNLVLLCAVAFPAAAGVALLRSGIANVVLGAEFRAAALFVIPTIALAALLHGMKAYYLDLSFQLGRRTTVQIWPVLAAGLVNVALNAWWIPRFGAGGAAWAAVVSYAVALAFSWRLGQRVFPLPMAIGELGRIALATGGMAVAVWPLLGLPGLTGLVAQTLVGGATYATLLWAANVAGVRAKLPHILKRVFSGSGT